MQKDFSKGLNLNELQISLDLTRAAFIEIYLMSSSGLHNEPRKAPLNDDQRKSKHLREEGKIQTYVAMSDRLVAMVFDITHW